MKTQELRQSEQRRLYLKRQAIKVKGAIDVVSLLGQSPAKKRMTTTLHKHNYFIDSYLTNEAVASFKR